MTVETDSEEIRKHFTPYAPPIPSRLKALKVLKDNRIAAQATIAPLLPSSKDFPAILSKLVDRVCIDDYYMGDGSGGKRTKRLEMYPKYEAIHMEQWYKKDTYAKLYRRFQTYFNDEQLYISHLGFMP